MRALIYPVFCLLSLVSCNKNDNPVTAYGTGDDYAIYKTIIEDTFNKNMLIVLYDSTVFSPLDSNISSYIKSSLPEIQSQTINNFIHANKQNISLKPVNTEFNIIFRSKYIQDSTKHAVHLSFSRAGYDLNYSEAIVSVNTVYGPLAGMGSIYYLKKENDVWKIKSTIGTWIS